MRTFVYNGLEDDEIETRRASMLSQVGSRVAIPGKGAAEADVIFAKRKREKDLAHRADEIDEKLEKLDIVMATTFGTFEKGVEKTINVKRLSPYARRKLEMLLERGALAEVKDEPENDSDDAAEKECLVEQAKALGVKGNLSGMKLETLKAKVAEAQA